MNFLLLLRQGAFGALFIFFSNYFQNSELNVLFYMHNICNFIVFTLLFVSCHFILETLVVAQA